MGVGGLQSHRKCDCGSIFVADALFCRMCGKERPKEPMPVQEAQAPDASSLRVVDQESIATPGHPGAATRLLPPPPRQERKLLPCGLTPIKMSDTAWCQDELSRASEPAAPIGSIPVPAAMVLSESHAAEVPQKAADTASDLTSNATT